MKTKVILLFCLLLFPVAASAQSGSSGSGSSSASGGSGILSFCGGPAAYCATTDTLIHSAIQAPPAGLFNAGNQCSGAGNMVVDPDLGERVERITDCGTLSDHRSFHTQSAAENNPWSSTNDLFFTEGNGGNMMLYSFNENTMAITALCSSTIGACAQDTNHVNYETDVADMGYLPADNRAFFTVAAGNTRPHFYRFDISSATNEPTTSTLLMDTSAGECSGMSFITGGSGANATWNKYMNSGDSGLSNGDDEMVTVGGYQQNDYRYVFVWDGTQSSGHQCRWFDSLTGEMGGSFGTATQASGWSPIPAPTATQFPSSNISSSTGGSLTAGHDYRVAVTYTNAQNPPNGATNLSPVYEISTGSNTEIQLTPPTAIAAPGVSPYYQTNHGYQVYACDDGPTPGPGSCTPTLQADASLAQPTGLSASCAVTGGGVSFSYYVVAVSAHHHSIPASVTVTNCTVVSGVPTATDYVNISWSSVTNATSYDVLRDDLNQRIANTASTSLEDTGQGIEIYADETSDASTSTTLASVVAASPQAPAVSEAGITLHNVKFERSGNWVGISSAFAEQPFLIWYVHDTAANSMISCSNPGDYQYADLQDPCGSHHAMLYGAMVGKGDNGSLGSENSWTEPMVTFNPSNPTAAGAAQNYFIGPLPLTGLEGVSAFDTHWSCNDMDTANSMPCVRSSYYQSGSVILPTGPWQTEIDVQYPKPSGASPTWRFCRDWTGGENGFFSSARGNISQDGRFFLFSSDMTVGATDDGIPGDGSASTTIGGSTAATGMGFGNGSTTGASQTTVNASRTDTYLCELR
jgi:hypothetical protein